MKKQQGWIWNAIGIFIGLLIILGIVTLYILKSDGSKCMANPLKYSADKLAKENQIDVTITASALGKEPFIYQANFKE